MFKQVGCTSFEDACSWTHHLPYGRNKNRGDAHSIFKEGQGTCSTKHAALTLLAEELEIDAKLVLAICKLNKELDPRCGPFLEKIGARYFPEAHCYMERYGIEADFSFPDQKPILKVEVLEKHDLLPGDIAIKKVQLHHDYIKKWMKDCGLDRQYSFDQLWSLRESWIASLSEK